jgi:hypothetical protein
VSWGSFRRKPWANVSPLVPDAVPLSEDELIEKIRSLSDEHACDWGKSNCAGLLICSICQDTKWCNDHVFKDGYCKQCEMSGND